MRASLLVLIAGCAAAPVSVTPLMPPGAQIGAARPASKIRVSVWTVASAAPRIEGRVREPTGAFEAGVTVVAVTAMRPNEQVAITDEDGTFHIADVAPGIYELTFYYEEGTYLLSAVPTAAATTTELDIVLEPMNDPHAREAQIL